MKLVSLENTPALRRLLRYRIASKGLLLSFSWSQFICTAILRFSGLKFYEFQPIIRQHVTISNLIYFFNAAVLTLMNDLPPFFSAINQSTSDHYPFARATPVSRLVIHVNRSQAKRTMISIAPILQRHHILMANCANKMCIFFFFAHFLPFLKLFEQIIKKVGFRLGLTVKPRNGS